MRCLVTGAAGFVGSHLCERLLRDGHAVIGLDAFVPYYPRSFKDNNLAGLMGQSSFEFVGVDLRTGELEPLLDGVEVVFHLAAMPGLPRSWIDFELYESCNVTATQRLLEACRGRKALKRFVHVSTSSVYGKLANGDELMPIRPVSPYGVTKFAAEQLVRAFSEEFDLPFNVLRYFSVYGPRQRPDMAYHKFVDALLNGLPITVFGDGQQVRGNTYVLDAVEATVSTLKAPMGETYNIGGGESVSVMQVIHKLESITGCMADVRQQPARAGDQRATMADTRKIQRHLGWSPKMSLMDGLTAQVEWQRGFKQISKAA